jgi:class 3 adenylate cyclase
MDAPSARGYGWRAHEGGRNLTTEARPTLDDARSAAAANRWPRAFELFQAAEREGPLSPGDLTLLGDAAWWVGQLGAAIAARERAYAAHRAAGDFPRAAGAALAVANDYSHRLESAMASGWVQRAIRLLEQLPESREHALLERALLNAALGRGDFEEALRRAERVMEIGTRLNDPDVQGLGLHDRGRVLVAAGRVDEGMQLLEEAVVAAVSGELSALPTAIVYCNATVACEDVADYRRAGEFAEGAKRWCERQEISGFPGMCRVRRAEITRLHGDWDEAEREARTACAELKDFCLDYAGEGYYQIGEIRMRLGDVAGADTAFKDAHALGRSPQPGLALLRLAEGRTAAAESLIREALADPGVTPLIRARLLPAAVEIALAAHNVGDAENASREMEQIADTYGTEALRAAAADARGLVAMRAGSAETASEALRGAGRLWQAIGAPYEAARSRLLLAEALSLSGSQEGARLEAGAALQAFVRLKAGPDAARAEQLLAQIGTDDRLSGGAKVTRTLMFTDIVRSTDLVEAIGDEAWESLRNWHDNTIRSLVREHAGEEVDHTGDGFFVAFPSPDQAIDCALAIRDTMGRHRREHGFAPSLRIGLHTTTTTRTRSGYSGAAVHAAARIAALAGADQIIVSEATLDAATRKVASGPAHEERLKGVRQPIRVVLLS